MRTNEELATIIAGRIHAVGEDLLADAETIKAITENWQGAGSSAFGLHRLGEELAEDIQRMLYAIEETMSNLGVPA